MLVGPNNMNYFKSTSRVHYIITYKGGKSGVAGVFQDKLFPFMHFFFQSYFPIFVKFIFRVRI